MKRQLTALLLVSTCMIASASEYRVQRQCEMMSPDELAANQPRKIWRKIEPSVAKQFKYETWEEVHGKPELVTQVPLIVVPAFGGWLLGDFRGEFGGELMFRSKDGETIPLVRDMIEDIYQLPFGMVVTAGLAHIGRDEGSIYVVTTNADNEPEVTKLHGLPGMPKSSWMLSDGSLLINTNNGSIVLTTDATLVPVECNGSIPTSP